MWKLQISALYFLQCALAAPITPEQGFPEIQQAIISDEREIQLAEGLFLLPETWILSQEANGKTITGMGPETVLSGAVEAGPWQLVDESASIWKCTSPLADGRPVRQMFQFGKGRLPRSRMPNEGWFRGDRHSAIDFDVNRTVTRDVANDWRVTRPHVFAGLRFRAENADQVQKLAENSTGAILQTISAWTSAWQPMRSLNPETRDIQLFTPSRYPLVHWNYGVNEGGGTPFAVENTRAGIDLPGEWCWNPDENTLLLKMETDPNRSRILVPSLDTVLRMDGARNLTLRNLTVAHSRTLFGRYDQHKDWKAAIQAWDPTFPDEFPEGHAVPQSAPFTGEAIHISNSTDVTLKDCVITGTGGYGIRFSSNTHQSKLVDCLLTDLGSGGVNIDPEIRNQETDYPTRIQVMTSEITHGGILHPAACAIRIAEASRCVLRGNRISHFGYSGISIGWAWNPRPNHTTKNFVIGNEISHVMQVLSDGAGIYTLGAIPGTSIEENYIHDIPRAQTAVGAGNSGIFFDQYSQGANVLGNRLERIQSWHPEDQREAHPIKHHRNLPSDHTFSGNTVDGEPFEPAADPE